MKSAEVLKAIPWALAENSGVKASEVISKLYVVYQEGNKNIGLGSKGEAPTVKNRLETGIVDTYLGKYWTIKLATDTAITISRVDQIIVAKPTSRPKPPNERKDWEHNQK